MEREWEVIVVGGGGAGLSAALVMGRARRRVLVLDAGGQSNLAAEGIGGLLGADREPPEQFYARCKRELEHYPTVEVRSGAVTDIERDSGLFVVVAGEQRERAARVLLATGMRYAASDIPGVAERWGRSVFHCPMCHGWEVRDGRLGMLTRGFIDTDWARLLRIWSDDVTFYENGVPLAAADRAQLVDAGIAVDDRLVAELRGPGDQLETIAFEDGTTAACDALLIPFMLRQPTELVERLGVAVKEVGPLTGDAIDVDAGFQTSIPNLYAVGDAIGTLPSAPGVIADGARAAGAIVRAIASDPVGHPARTPA